MIRKITYFVGVMSKKSKKTKERLKKKEIKKWYNEVLTKKKKTLYRFKYYVWMKLIATETEALLIETDLSGSELEKKVIDNVYNELNTDLDIWDRLSKEEKEHFHTYGCIEFIPNEYDI